MAGLWLQPGFLWVSQAVQGTAGGKTIPSMSRESLTDPGCHAGYCCTCKLPMHGETEGGLSLVTRVLLGSLQGRHQDLLVGGCHGCVVGAREGPGFIQG